MLTFPNITPEVFALVIDQLRAEATVTEVAPGYFNVDGNGIRARTSAPMNGELNIYIDDKPFFISEGMIGSKIRDAITLAQQAVAKGDGGRAA